MRLSMEAIHVFILVADLGSFSATGRHLKKAQSAISSSIANLEIDLGVTLFDRSSSKLKLTGEGQALLSQAKDIIQRNNQLLLSAEELSLGFETQLNIAIDHIIPIIVLLPALEQLAEKYPNLDLRLHHTSGGEIEKLLSENQVDFAILPYQTPHENVYSIERIFDFEMLCVVHPEHPIAQIQQPIAPKYLDSYRQLVLTDHSDMSGNRDKGILCKQLWRARDMDYLIELTKAKLGWTFVGYEQVKADLEKGDLIHFTPEGWQKTIQMPIVAVHHLSKKLGPASSLFLKTLKQDKV